MPRGRKPGFGRPLAERFWEKVSKTDGCWLWTGAVSAAGYGQIGADAVPGVYRPRVLYAHRLSWEWANGPIPEGKLVCHHCDVPACVRPDHLFLGSAKDNMVDAAGKGRMRSGNEKLTEADVVDIRASAASSAELAARYGVHPGAIRKVRRGRTWRHLPMEGGTR